MENHPTTIGSGNVIDSNTAIKKAKFFGIILILCGLAQAGVFIFVLIKMLSFAGASNTNVILQSIIPSAIIATPICAINLIYGINIIRKKTTPNAIKKLASSLLVGTILGTILAFAFFIVGGTVFALLLSSVIPFVITLLATFVVIDITSIAVLIMYKRYTFEKEEE